MAACKYVDVLITVNKGTGQVDLTAASNWLKLFQLEHEDSQHRRILISTVPEGRTGTSFDRSAKTAKFISVRLRRTRRRRDRWGRFAR
jgi:hypothetical protein